QLEKLTTLREFQLREFQLREFQLREFQLREFQLREFQLTHRITCFPQICELHLRVLTRKEHAVCTAPECRLNRLLRALRATLRTARTSRNIDVNARPQQRLSPGETGSCALRLAQDVLGAETRSRNFAERFLVLIVEDEVVEV